MKRAFKIIAVSVLVAVVLMAGTALFFVRMAARSPEKVTAAVQNQLSRHFPIPVSIARARFEWKQGPRVILTNVRLDSPGAITLRIKSITAYLTIWRLVFGEVAVKKLRLVEPSGVLDYGGMKKLRLDKGSSGRPVVVIWKGSVKFIYNDIDLPLSDLSGRVTRDWVNLRARTLGGRVLLQADLASPGKLTFDAYGMPLDQLDSSFRGTANMSLAMEDMKSGKSGSFSFQAKDLSLPFMKGTLNKVVAAASLATDSRKMSISDISIKTPVAEVSGRAVILGIQDPANLRDAILTVEASSKEFNYEKVVSMLPTQKFPDWLKDLLTKQIRGGKSRFSAAKYHGPIKDLFSGVALLDNLHVVQELGGQSFSSGYTPERITGITGQVIYGRGDIRFSSISGTIGSSRLKKVDIVFPGAIRPLMRVGVDVELDMPASDFMSAWHAAMVPPEVHKLLQPVSRVKNGQVTAKVNTYYDEEAKAPFKCRGDIKLGSCSYSWAGHAVTSQSASMHAESFSSPIRIMLSGLFEKVNIKRLDLSLTSPFKDNASRYALIAESLPGLGKISLENGTLRINGSGRGTNLKGTFELGSSGISYAADGYSLQSGATTSKGEYKAKIGDQASVEVSNALISTPASTIHAEASIKPGEGYASLGGALNLKDLSLRNSQGIQALKGLSKGSLKVSWGSIVSYDAELSFSDAALPYQNGFMTIDGPLTATSSNFSTQSLRIASGETSVTLSGKLTTGDDPFFKGSALIKGFGADGEGASLKGLEHLSAEADISFKDCIFSGLPIESATARAELRKGVLSLSNLEMDTVSGTARGSITLSMDGKSDFDMSISIKGADMRRLMRATKVKSVMDGTIDMEGRIFGQPDSLNGSIAVTAKDGEIRKYALFSQIFSVLNVYKLIQNRDTDFLSNHFKYNTITSSFTIKDSVIEFDDFALDSNSVQISAVGRCYLKTRKMDAHIGVQPLETIDLTVSKIPLVGWVLTDEKGKMIVVNMRLKGTMDEPSVQVEPISSLSNTVAGSLLRSLKLPNRLVDESLQLINGKN